MPLLASTGATHPHHAISGSYSRAGSLWHSLFLWLSYLYRLCVSCVELAAECELQGFLGDVIGRKPLLICSLTGLSISLAIMSLAAFIETGTSVTVGLNSSESE